MLKCPAPDGSLLPPRHRPFFFEALDLMAQNGFRDKFVRPQLPELAERFAALAPSDDELLAWYAELKAWVRWYRVPSYWLCALFQNGTVRLHSLHAALASCLFANAQILFCDDFALASLETAYVGVQRNRAAFPTAFDGLLAPLERLLADYREHLARWAAPFDYLRCNPLADHPYSRLTAQWLAEDLAAAPRLGDERWLREVIDRADAEAAVWHRVAARRFLGLCLAAKGDDAGRLAQFGAGLAIALEHRLDTEIGQLRRLRGKCLRDLGRLDEAIAEFEAAIRFESAAPAQEFTTYWQTLGLRGLGDTLMQRAAATPGALAGGADNVDVLQALNAYRAGRHKFGLHLAIQCPQPLARAAKHQMQRSFADNALLAAGAGRRWSDLLAEWEEAGPREATGMVSGMAAPDLAAGTDADRVAFRHNRARYFAALNTAPPPLANYLADIVASAPERRLYLERHVAMAGHLARTQRGDAIAERLLALRLPDTLFLLFHVGPNSGSLLLVDLATGSVAPLALAFGERQVRAWHADYQRDWQSAVDTAGKSLALRRHLARYEQALAPVLEPMLRFFPGRHVKIFARLQMNAVPFHALQFGGRTLLQHAETISYGQTLGLFLANHDARQAERPAPCRLRVVVGSKVPWYRQILPGLRERYRSELDEHAQASWPELLNAIARRPARDTVFFCHGRFDATRVAESALELGRPGLDGEVSFARVFEEFDLPGCRSVIMGSCESGVARTEVAAEYLGLPTAMLASGVRYVVGALWTIPQLATAVVMERLLAALHDEPTSVAVVLSRVQREMLELDRDRALGWVAERLDGRPELPKLLAEIRKRGEHPFADPYQWAGLQTLGDL